MLQNYREPRFKVAKFTHRRRSIYPADEQCCPSPPDLFPCLACTSQDYGRAPLLGLRQASQRDTSPPHTPIYFFLGHQEVSNVWSLEESQAALHLFPERTRTTGPPAMGDAGESSGESRVSKHATCWVCPLKLVPALRSSPLTSPVPSRFPARQLAGGRWICTGFVG